MLILMYPLQVKLKIMLSKRLTIAQKELLGGNHCPHDNVAYVY